MHPHALKHGLTEQKVRYAWEHFVVLQTRKPPRHDQVAAIGVDSQGRLVQLVAVRNGNEVLIFHAMRNPTKQFLAELRLGRSEGREPWN